MPKLTRYFLSFFVLCLSTILTMPVYAADITVNSSCSLADAINAANSDAATGGCLAGSGADAITLTGNFTLDSPLPEIESEVTIEGNGYTISGNKQHQIFWVKETGTLTILNVTLADGRGVDDDDLYDDDVLIGGAIMNWGILTVSDSIFTGNSADWGGATFNDDRASLNVSNSTFNSNSAVRGGAIYYAGEKSLRISSSNFTGNSASLGGTVYKSGAASLSISSSNFAGNSASRGGAIFSAGDASVGISESNFSDNSASASGGAIYTGGGAILSISASDFSKNSAWFNGGAVFNNEEANIVESSFANNTADSEGGAVFSNTRDTITISRCRFSGNVAGEKGGALHSGGASINGSSFTANSAELSGGAIVIWVKAHISDSTFLDNSAVEEDGGAIHSRGDISIGRSNFKGNSAGDEGGAIRSTEDSEVDVSLGFFRDNSAEDGGAIYSWGELSVSRSTFINNSAEEEGGAIANHGIASINASILADNFGGDCHLGRKGELLESGDNHISDGSCGATWSGHISDGYCPPGQERDGVCQIGALELASADD